MEVFISNLFLYKPLVKTIIRILDYSTIKIDSETYSTIINFIDLIISIVYISFYIYAFFYMYAYDKTEGFFYDRRRKIVLSVILLVVVITLIIINYNDTIIEITQQKRITNILSNIRFFIAVCTSIYSLMKIYSSHKKLMKGIEYTSIKRFNALVAIAILLVSIATNIAGLYTIKKT
jgi:hypothetical protein